MMEARAKSVKYWSRRLAHRIRKPLKPGDLVLVYETFVPPPYNKSLESQWGNLFKNRWNGPYRIVGQVNNGTFYAASHIKRFYPRGVIIEEGEEEDENQEEDTPALGED
ncbi:hypothetical protein PPACK8108_LOCUS21106 [Phakopsora pachyrhizi]|uniref:Uncharacterized protein n=1 Tax=Phakopsora pachyrhizi TaxID=170000 RepID=A0AAV0BJ35_PHAPC|nr:hypothetical protein PPACK8108_LOCUS21106 [Phakopsora pachyrhizi]